MIPAGDHPEPIYSIEGSVEADTFALQFPLSLVPDDQSRFENFQFIQNLDVGRGHGLYTSGVLSILCEEMQAHIPTQCRIVSALLQSHACLSAD